MTQTFTTHILGHFACPNALPQYFEEQHTQNWTPDRRWTEEKKNNYTIRAKPPVTSFMFRWNVCVFILGPFEINWLVYCRVCVRTFASNHHNHAAVFVWPTIIVVYNTRTRSKLLIVCVCVWAVDVRWQTHTHTHTWMLACESFNTTDYTWTNRMSVHRRWWIRLSS